MSGTERRTAIMEKLKNTTAALSGSALAREFQVSRQVIVQDIALLRANGENILSTNLGYVLFSNPECNRVFKVQHTDQETEEELCLFVDCGATVKDVFVYHKVYDTVRADLNIRTREDVRQFMEQITSGKSTLLKNITSGYHYHTVTADSENLLDKIQDKLKERGFLAPLQDYEPVTF